MAKTFRTKSVADIDLTQVIITDTVDESGAPEIRIRANVGVTIENAIDPRDTHVINIGVNEPLSSFSGLGPHLLAIKQAILQLVRSQA